MNAARVVAASLLALVAFGGCMGGSAGSAAPTSASGGGGANPGASIVSGSLGPVVLDPILDDAAARLGTARTAVEVVTAESRTWPDGSLGCPQPGMAYTQIVTDGYRVVVRAGARTLDYRGTAPGRFRMCEAVTPS
ncbi:MAG TPA: hypothetical protein VFI28_05055 [Candidatus Limnocylindrales bacterium]|nr:hypothetical protein [Candidatus Limnocylindrales bacterium]